MRTLLAVILKLFGALVVLLLLAAALVYLSDPVFWRRVFTLPMADAYKAIDWFSPQEVVEAREREIPVAAEGQRSIDAAALAAIEQYGTQTDSIAVIVYHRGAIQFEKYWPGFARGTRTESASMHKTVTGLLVGAAIADGSIGSLDDPLGKYLTEWSRDPRGEITVRQLLQMSSGLEVSEFSLNPFGRSMQVHMGTDLARVALATPLAETPGTRFDYGNLNAQLLGMVIERASGQRYARYLSARLWRRIGAGRASVWLDREGGLARTYCCLLTHARSWLQVGRLLLGKGEFDGEQIVPAEWIEQTITPAPTNPNYGFLVWLGAPAGGQRRYSSAGASVALHSEPFRADDVIFLDGLGGQRTYVVPSQDLIIVRVGRPQPDWDDAKLVNIAIDGLVTVGAH